MLRKGIVKFLCLFLTLFGGVTSLRDVMLLVDPKIVTRGGTAALICARDMQDALLYSVKWYRGNHEFYRYTPQESPETRVFELPGINVDINRSNGSQVLLRRLDLGMAGNFSCEVTADAPSFATQIAAKFIDITELPTSGPVLKADKDRYQPGEVLKVNCTSGAGRPAANLTVFVNEEPLRSSETSLHPSESGLLWTNVKADVKVSSDLFVGGRLRVACIATVFDVYQESATLDFFTPDTDPKPQRIVTLNSASKCFQNWILLFLLLLLPMAMCQGDWVPDVSVDYYYDYEADDALKSLIGG